MTLSCGNLTHPLPLEQSVEFFETLLTRPGVRIERIISYGQATPAGEWYDQSWDEWVMLVAGAACLLLAGEEQPRSLQPGDYLLLPAGCRHRVAWTDPARETVWLAVHIGEPAGGHD